MRTEYRPPHEVHKESIMQLTATIREKEECLIDLDNVDLVRRILEEDHLVLVADGSVQHSAGSHAFVLATPSATKIRLVQSSGKCPGALSQMHSFRAENFGVLAGISAASQIITKMYAVTDAPAASEQLIKMPLKVYCDNNALVKRISRWRQLPWLYPNECLVNDFDVSHQLLIQSKWFQNVTFNHVRGHQDSRKNKEQLTWEEELNIDCDHRARDAVSKYPTDTDTPRLSSDRAQVRINGIAVTGSLATNLRIAAHTPDLRDYLKQRWNWDDRTIDYIDWYTMGRAMHRVPIALRTFVVKLSHGWLPVQHNQHKWDNCQPKKCPYCSEPDETIQHFLTCQHPTATKAQKRMIGAIRRYTQKTNTDPVIQTLLLHSLQNPNAENRFDTKHYPERYHRLIKQQQSIGWIHVYYGRLGTEWVEQHTIATNSDGEKWASGLFIQLWQELHTTWKERCATVHKNDESLEREYLENKLRLLYSAYEKLNHIDKDFLNTDIETRLKHSTTKLKNWINDKEPKIRARVKADAKAKQGGHRSIHEFFSSTAKLPAAEPQPPKKKGDRRKAAKPPPGEKPDNKPSPLKRLIAKAGTYVQTQVTRYFARPPQRKPPQEDSSTKKPP